MGQKIGRVPNKKSLYPNVFSVVINRKLAKCRKKGEVANPSRYFDYARLVERRYNRLFRV